MQQRERVSHEGAGDGLHVGDRIADQRLVRVHDRGREDIKFLGQRGSRGGGVEALTDVAEDLTNAGSAATD